jgi:hypothetical protein
MIERGGLDAKPVWFKLAVGVARLMVPIQKSAYLTTAIQS